MAENPAPGTAVAAPRLTGVIVAATIGNVLEWFDFLVYGFFAVTIAEVFFPVGNPTVSLLITFGAFGLSYVVRPLGAAVIGTYTDRAGRKAGLTLSIGLMMIGTTLMVVTPGYATIGIAAPIIITIARLLQGFSVGGEFGSAVAFLVEHAGDRKGYSASWQWASIGIISIIVSLFGLALTTLLTHQQLVDWGWRIPYVFGLLVGPVGLYIRSRMAETPEFLDAVKAADGADRRVAYAAIRSRSCWRSAPRSSRTAPITCCSIFRPMGSRRCICRPIPALRRHWSAASCLPSFRSLRDIGPTRPARHAHHADHGLAVRDRRLPDILADGRLSFARHRDVRRRLPQPDQGGIQRRAAVAAGGAVSGRHARGRHRVQLQHLGDDLRRLRPVCRDMADRARPATRCRPASI